MLISTGLRNALATASSLKDTLAGCVINIYAGTTPASADDALGMDATLLCVISGEGTGAALEWENTAVGGALTKLSSQAWRGTAEATGSIAYYRMQLPSDDGTASSSRVRLQGTAGVVGADLNMSSATMTSGAVQTIDYATITVPSAS